MNDITISYLLRLLLRRLYIIVLAAVLCGGLAFSYCRFLVTPVYAANTQLIISNGAVIIEDKSESAVSPTDDISKISSMDLQASMYLSGVCVDLLQSQKAYEKLSEALDSKLSYAELKKNITVSLKSQDSLFINITVKSTSKEEAIKIANTFVSLAPEYLTEYMPSAKAIPTQQANGASLVYPTTVRTSALAFIIGALVAYIIVLIVDVNDKTIKDEENFAECYNIPVLGCVPDFETVNEGGYNYGRK